MGLLRYLIKEVRRYSIRVGEMWGWFHTM